MVKPLGATWCYLIFKRDETKWSRNDVAIDKDEQQLTGFFEREPYMTGSWRISSKSARM